jgi:phosphoribosylanthranilate isomerase
MALEVKICGLSTNETLSAALAGGADLVGLVFYARSPRALSPRQAAALAAQVPQGVCKVGLFVDADDETLAQTAHTVGLDMLQLHGEESPSRVAAIKAATGLPVMKVIKLRQPEDLAIARDYLEVADRLLFDAKPPPEATDALPGGNALSFDWHMLAGTDWPLPWMLAGGLTAANLAEAVAVTGARAVDVSSGVESAPGRKDPALIRKFLATARSL